MNLDNFEMKNVLVQYVRDKHNTKRGVVVSIPSTGVSKFKLGYSLCKHGEEFDRKMGLKIALGRAACGREFDIPHSIVPTYYNMIIRSERYYK